MTSGEQAAGIYGASLTMVLVLTLIWWILLIVARWKIFTKAGEAGWKSIIPIYSDYVQWRIGWKRTGLFWGAIALVFVGYALLIAGGMIAVDSSSGSMSVGGGGILGIVGVVCMLAGIIINLIAVYKLFVSFGKGVGWFILYILFPNFVLLALGFGASQHQGAQD